jgi:hypothetical protein
MMRPLNPRSAPTQPDSGLAIDEAPVAQADDQLRQNPPLPRLNVDLARRTITLDGMVHEVHSALALRWVKVLAEHTDEWISSNELKNYDSELDGTRPDRLKRFLPPEILSLIDTDKSRGSRLRLTEKPQ